MANSSDLSRLDQEQIIKLVVDEPNKRLRTSAEVSFPPDLDVGISHTEDSIRLGDGTNLVTSTNTGGKQALDVNIAGGVVNGTFTPSGLQNALATSQQVITSTTPVAIPTAVQANRNGISVRNLGPDTVWIAGSTADTPGIGGSCYPKFINEEFVIDITDDINFYACVETGKTANLAFMQVS